LVNCIPDEDGELCYTDKNHEERRRPAVVVVDVILHQVFIPSINRGSGHHRAHRDLH
jgi:hypothetical protein